VQLLLELQRLGTLPRRYRLLERSADLRERQRALLLQHCAHLMKSIEWLDAPPVDAWCGCLIANEVIDALPVHLFALREESLLERVVGVGARGEFAWREHSADAALSAAVANVIGDTVALPRPYCSEVRPLLRPWLAEVTGSLEQGMAWFIDYGYARDNYYASQRREGTLRCHYRHRAHDNPLILPGLQDITAWVDFDALIDAGAAAGFALDDNVTQAQFLIAHGLDEVFAAVYAEVADEVARYHLAQEVKRLTLPGEMGERFRVIALRIARGG